MKKAVCTSPDGDVLIEYSSLAEGEMREIRLCYKGTGKYITFYTFSDGSSIGVHGGNLPRYEVRTE
jgi:hypothetical protein